MTFLRASLLIFSFAFVFVARAQEEMIYKPYIKTLQLYRYGNQQGLPIYTLNSDEQIMLSFDDLEGSVKNYYYSYVLCDYDWQPVNVSPFDYIKGFTQNRISLYRQSSIAYTRYTHYQALLPDRNAAVPIRSGNYLLKVFLDGDPSKLVFTKRMYVLDQKATISAEVKQPFTPQLYSTHQKIKFTASVKDINTFSAAQQIKAVILQNNRWDNALKDIAPTFVRGNVLQYDSENIGIFPGGKEWRWLDLRSFRLQSDRVEDAKYSNSSTEIYLKPDVDRRGQRYQYFPDYNGMYNIVTYESINPFWQGDYATVHFSFAPPGGVAYPEQDLFLEAAFTGFARTEQWAMKYNASTQMYEGTAFLKQGYYNYAYVLQDRANPAQAVELEGNYWETENSYTILLYYKSFTDRSHQLIGVAQLDSRTDKPGFSF